MINVGLLLQLRGMWRGGVVYYMNLLECFQGYQNGEVRLEVFTDRPEDLARFQGDGLHIRKCAELSLDGILNWPRRKLRRTLRNRLGYDPVLLKLMERNKIDLLTHISLGSQTALKTLPWQPDFQHKLLPQFFSPEECAGRDIEIAKSALWGNLLLSSQDAADTFRRSYPELFTVKTHVLTFPNISCLSVDTFSRKELETRYPVTKPYFFLPNQFWYHKNHRVVVEALRSTSPEIRIVCTGLMEDRRNLSYVPELLDQVKRDALEQRFICLGELPYRVMISLMRHSIAVVQPSLFEGWSTTVEEAKAMGKKIILSNIGVHLEQAPDRSVYFPPNSPENLAACLERVYKESDAIADNVDFSDRAEYKTQVARKLSENFAGILKTASGVTI